MPLIFSGSVTRILLGVFGKMGWGVGGGVGVDRFEVVFLFFVQPFWEWKVSENEEIDSIGVAVS